MIPISNFEFRILGYEQPIKAYQFQLRTYWRWVHRKCSTRNQISVSLNPMIFVSIKKWKKRKHIHKFVQLYIHLCRSLASIIISANENQFYAWKFVKGNAKQFPLERNKEIIGFLYDLHNSIFKFKNRENILNEFGQQYNRNPLEASRARLIDKTQMLFGKPLPFIQIDWRASSGCANSRFFP